MALTTGVSATLGGRVCGNGGRKRAGRGQWPTCKRALELGYTRPCPQIVNRSLSARRQFCTHPERTGLAGSRPCGMGQLDPLTTTSSLSPYSKSPLPTPTSTFQGHFNTPKKMAPSNTESVAVPETLLKKRRVNEKTREEKLAKAAEAKKVSLFPSMTVLSWGREVIRSRFHDA